MVWDLIYSYLRNANDDSNDTRKINIPTVIPAVSSLFWRFARGCTFISERKNFLKGSIFIQYYSLLLSYWIIIFMLQAHYLAIDKYLMLTTANFWYIVKNRNIICAFRFAMIILILWISAPLKWQSADIKWSISYNARNLIMVHV